MSKKKRTILVCGGRDLKDEPWVYAALSEVIAPGVRVVQGGASGADKIAAGFAEGMGCEVLTFPADWKTHGRAAGPIRNAEMLTRARPDLVLAFPGGRGTRDMTLKAQAAGVPILCALPSGELLLAPSAPAPERAQ